MAKLPLPPAGPPGPLQPGDTQTLRTGTRVYKVYFSGGAHPASWSGFRYFGPTASRFDHQLLLAGKPASQPRGIQYLASDPTTCLAEVFQQTRVIDRHAGAPRLVGFALARNLRLLDLTTPFITRVGASAAISAGRKDRARAWSRYLYRHYRNAHGLRYASSMHANAAAFAFYERARAGVPAVPLFDRALSDAALASRLVRAAAAIGYALV